MRIVSLVGTMGLALSTLAGVAACSDSGGSEGDPSVGPSDVNSAEHALVKSDLPRDESPDVTAEELAATAAGERAFSWDLYHQVVTPSENLFVSPYSISTALAMAYGAADGDTKSEMAEALHFDLPDDKFHASYNALDLALRSRNLPATGELRALELSVNNAFWVQTGLEPQPSYLDLLAEDYGTGLYLVDFGETEATRQLINGAVADWTKQKIEELLAPGILSPATTAVLTNTIYLFAPWETPFDENATAPAPFINQDETTVEVDTMMGEVDVRYAAGDGYEVLALPYRSGTLDLVIALPDADGFDAFEAELDDARASEFVAELQPSKMRVYLPKFSLRTATSLNPALKALGMESAFDAPEFPGLGSAEAPISDVVHEAFVEVTEAGTEAAAATAVAFEESAPEGEVRVDHPFIFFIRDVPTDAILFVGRVVTLP